MTSAAKPGKGTPDPAPAGGQGAFDDVVSALAGHGVRRNYAKNTIIITEGDPSDSIYVILSGRVKVFLSDDAGKEVVLAIYGAGQYVGEMALDERPRSASVMTLEPCVLSVVTQKEFRAFLASNPDAAFHLIRKLIHRAREASESVRSLALMDVYGRVARLLLELATEENGELVVTEALTQQVIAQRVGCSREMISRIFKDLTAGGYIRIDRRRIHLKRSLPSRW